VLGNLLDDAVAKGGERLHLLDGDLSDMDSLLSCVTVSRPDEVYNLAAMSFVGESWEHALQTTEINAVGALRLLEAETLDEADAYAAACRYAVKDSFPGQDRISHAGGLAAAALGYQLFSYGGDARLAGRQ
jgi:UDP-glucose 4-epimerase